MPILGPTSVGGSDDEAGGEEILAEINITPLTDIFLVLLIIFMVTSSVMSQMGVDVELPEASKEVSGNQPDGVILTLLQGGAMEVNGIRIGATDWSTLEARIKEAFEQTESRLIILEGDRQAYLGNAIEVMDRARAAGARTFAIATTIKSN